VAGSTLTQKDFILSDMDTVNRFVLDNPNIATITKVTSSDSSQVTDAAGDLTAVTPLSSFVQSGKLRFTCDDLATNNKRFIVSQDCDTTDSGVAKKSIYDLKDVATYIATLTLDTSAYQVCYDYKTWTEFSGFYDTNFKLKMPVDDAFVDAYNLAGIQAIRRLGAADKDAAKVLFGLQCDGAATG